MRVAFSYSRADDPLRATQKQRTDAWAECTAYLLEAEAIDPERLAEQTRRFRRRIRKEMRDA